MSTMFLAKMIEICVHGVYAMLVPLEDAEDALIAVVEVRDVPLMDVALC